MTTILLTVLTFSAILSMAICWLYIGKTRELRGLQARVASIDANRRTAIALANEANEYSKKNPSIDPILERAGVKMKGATATNKAGTK